MVIGNGMVAKRFSSYKDDDRFLIFASGVSNSKSNDHAAYSRERQLLEEAINTYKEKTIVYFSTCSIEDPGEKGSLYTEHKKNIESIIAERAPQHRILRVSNIVGRSSNPNTLLNFFYHHIRNGINFDLWSHSTRNLVDMDDVFAIADHILQNDLLTNTIIPIANPVSYPVKDIVTAIESFTGITANYITIEKGSSYSIDISVILPIIEKLGWHFDESYLERMLHKYYEPA